METSSLLTSEIQDSLKQQCKSEWRYIKMIKYRGYEIPEYQDLNSVWFTFTGNVTIISDNVIFDTDIHLDELRGLSNEEINAYIYDRAKKLVDEVKEIEDGQTES